jgi:hypothetical protein
LFHAKDANVLVVAQWKLPQISSYKSGVAENSMAQSGKSGIVYQPRIQLYASAFETNFCCGNYYPTISASNVQESFVFSGPFFGQTFEDVVNLCCGGGDVRKAVFSKRNWKQKV